MVPKMIFFHIGWMKHYRGPDDDDPTKGPHGHLKDNTFGHECFNFFLRNESCYGYAPITGIDIPEHFGASKDTKFLDSVVCVWIAKVPKRKTRVIVGWYKEGKIFRYRNRGRKPSGNKLDGEAISYLAMATGTACTLVPVSRRTFVIPTRYDMDGGLGQSTVWYGGNTEFREKVWEYINSWDGRKGTSRRRLKSQGGGGGRRNTDPALRQEIERIAVDTAIGLFSSEDGGGYKVKDRQKDNVGWDLEARRPGKKTLLIEVKGLSSKEVSVELTPNEYSQMTAKKNRGKYVLFVVTDCLGTSPLAHDYRFKDGRWSDVDGTELDVKERTGAVCRSRP